MMSHFVTLPKLPTVKYTAEFVLNSSCIATLSNAVSDRYTQFASFFFAICCEQSPVCPLGSLLDQWMDWAHELRNGSSLEVPGLQEPLFLVVTTTVERICTHLLGLLCHWSLSPFQCAYGYQPSLFPAQKKKVSCPSVQAFIRCSCRRWLHTHSTLCGDELLLTKWVSKCGSPPKS